MQSFPQVEMLHQTGAVLKEGGRFEVKCDQCDLS